MLLFNEENGVATDIMYNFNTSNVTIQQNKGTWIIAQAVFQYI